MNLTVDDVTFKRYPHLLIKAAQRAISIGLTGRLDIMIHPLCNFIYKDGQQMLTFTAIVLENSDMQLDSFLQNSRINFWPFYSGDWGTVKNISVPTMSLRERIFIEERLPTKDHEEITNDLGFYIGDDEAEANSNLKNFIEYYKVIPWYSKVLL
ncbi:hypothetical protein KS610_000306 [Escherichia coli]|nr:hypothetical protein [Escherichia coli]